ncbi:MAG: hypothetical protein ACTSR6_04500 [Candidatus Heimdallarchaeota archaeon]
MDVKDRLQSAVSHQTDLNPIYRLQKGVRQVLGEVLEERRELAEMQKMKIEVSSKGPFAKLRTQSKIKKKRNFIQNKLMLNKEVAFQLACLSSYLTQFLFNSKNESNRGLHIAPQRNKTSLS